MLGGCRVYKKGTEHDAEIVLPAGGKLEATTSRVKLRYDAFRVAALAEARTLKSEQLSQRILNMISKAISFKSLPGARVLKVGKDQKVSRKYNIKECRNTSLAELSN
jgi:hypothetical protein